MEDQVKVLGLVSVVVRKGRINAIHRVLLKVNNNVVYCTRFPIYFHSY